MDVIARDDATQATAGKSSGPSSVPDAGRANPGEPIGGGGSAAPPNTAGGRAAIGGGGNVASGRSGAGGEPVSSGHAGSGGMGGTSQHAGAAAVGGMAGSQEQGGTPSADAPPDPDCDVHGFWVGRLTTFSRDTVVSSVQTASNWFFYEIAQSGRDIHIASSLNCGIQVSGSADVTLNAATTKSLIHLNSHMGRKGQSYREGDKCVFSMERFYSVRGVPREVYLPADTSSNPELSSITPALPTEMKPEGAVDTDGDGMLGIAYQVSGLGSRSVVQRDWNEWSSKDIALSPMQVVATADFDNQEEILSTSGTLGALLRAGSSPARNLRHRFTMRLLGRNASDAGVTKIRVMDDLQTCFNVQDALPHDAAMQ